MDLPPRGTLYSWVVVHRTVDPVFAAGVPYTIALIELAGGARLALRLKDGLEGLTAGEMIEVCLPSPGEFAMLTGQRAGGLASLGQTS
jgi:uncharacterized OB-fold protein